MSSAIRLSQRVRDLTPSPIREIFSHAPEELADCGLRILADLLRHSDASHAAPAFAPPIGRRRGSPVR